MIREAIIDIGSNTIRLSIVDCIDDNYSVIKSMSVFVGLASSLYSTGRLSDEIMNSAIDTIKKFHDVCLKNNAKSITAVATAAVRRAENGEVLIKRIKEEININAIILDQKTEAQMDFYGVINTFKIDDGLIIDMGGGSTQIVSFKNRELVNWFSLPFGSLILTEVTANKSEEFLFAYIENELSKVEWLKEIESDSIIGLGGSVRSIAKISLGKKKMDIEQFHGHKMEIREIKEIYNELKKKSIEEKEKIIGLEESRAKIITVACGFLSFFMEKYNVNILKVSSTGIQEGLLSIM